MCCHSDEGLCSLGVLWDGVIECRRYQTDNRWRRRKGYMLSNRAVKGRLRGYKDVTELDRERRSQRCGEGERRVMDGGPDEGTRWNSQEQPPRASP